MPQDDGATRPSGSTAFPGLGPSLSASSFHFPALERFAHFLNIPGINKRSHSLLQQISISPTMEAQRKTFMLLPDFSYPPSRDILLGTVLPWSKETKLPDPEYPLNEGTRVTPPENVIRTQVEQGWSSKHVKGTLVSPSIDAELPVFSPVSGTAAYNKTGSQTLNITCDLKTESFAPSPQYLADTLNDPQVSAQCHKYWKPSVYLVTGLMVAENATIESITDGSHSGNIHGGVDTSGFGVPLNVGAGLEGSKSSFSKLGTSLQESFITSLY
jgi:hypothetical protein